MGPLDLKIEEFILWSQNIHEDIQYVERKSQQVGFRTGGFSQNSTTEEQSSEGVKNLSTLQMEVQTTRNQILYQDSMLEQLETMEKLEKFILEVETILNREQHAKDILEELEHINQLETDFIEEKKKDKEGRNSVGELL